MKIETGYSPILRQTVEPVTVFDAKLAATAREMFKLMEKSYGMGLAANQIGLNQQLAVIYRPEDEDGPELPRLVICNPKITKYSQEKNSMVEACLSLPGIELPVVRPAGVEVEAQDLAGKPLKIRAKGLLARVLQHEIDHLNGVLFTDRSRPANLKDLRFANVAFFGSDDFSLPILESLVDAKLNIVGVFTQPDRPQGRGGIVGESLIKQAATKLHLPVYQPDNKEDITKLISALKPHLIVLASYGLILPADSLDIPTWGALNLHPSLLPKYRGATPIQTALLNGDAETGLSLMTMSPQVDAGQLVAQKALSIEESDTSETLRTKLADLGARTLIEQLPKYLSAQAQLQSQDPTQVTGTKKLTKEDGLLDWSDSAVELDRQIRALAGWPGTYTTMGDKRLKIIEAELKADQLQLKKVQLEGKSVADWSDFVRGYQKELTKTDWFAKIA